MFFGVIDLSVVIAHDERFRGFYLLETGWGLLYTVLVGLPLVGFALRPRSAVALQQVFVVGVAVLAGAAVAPAPAQVVPGLLLAGTAVGLSGWSGHGWVPLRGLTVRGVDLRMVVLVVVVVVAAVAYAVQVLHAAGTGEPDDETWGLRHLPMQASFGLSVAAAAGLSALARAAHRSGWQVPAASAAVSAGWFGLVSFAYPDLLGSLGRPTGVATICWGLTLAGVTVTKQPAKNRPATNGLGKNE